MAPCHSRATYSSRQMYCDEAGVLP
jgi:hypothetical protein